MAVTTMKYETSHGWQDTGLAELSCRRLQPGEEAEALNFLAKRPIHTVVVASLIRENGAVSLHNRGFFYVCRDRAKKIEGVALIGHATIVEARTDRSVAAFAQLAAHSQHAHLVRGERAVVDTFWKYYSEDGRSARLVCREMLFEKAERLPEFEPVTELRPATLAEAEHVVAINAQLAMEERDSNPLKSDPAGFRARVERRIKQGRVWIWMRDGKPVFKADVISDTPEMIYLEGIHVHPDVRKQGYGKRGLVQLCSNFARQNRSACLTINQRRAYAVAFYAQAGFEYHSEYQTIYLR